MDRVDLPNAPDPSCSENGICDANLSGTWTISDRCDRTGTLSIQSDCGSAVNAAWQAMSLGGEVVFGDTDADWTESIGYEWTVDASDFCSPSCEAVPSTLGSEWAFLSCAPSEGSCICQGTNVHDTVIDGYYSVSSEGIVLTPFDSVTDPSVPVYRMQVCADTSILRLYSEDFGNLILSRKD